MSCTIHIETERDPANPKAFECIWSVSGEDYNIDEHSFLCIGNDRLMASIISIGKACRTLADNEVVDGVIEIKSDGIKPDQRYAGEHDVLFGLLCPEDEFKGLKARSLYNEYSRYLGRVKQLQLQWNIRIRLAE